MESVVTATAILMVISFVSLNDVSLSLPFSFAAVHLLCTRLDTQVKQVEIRIGRDGLRPLRKAAELADHLVAVDLQNSIGPGLGLSFDERPEAPELGPGRTQRE